MYLFALFAVLYELSTYLANDMILPGMLQVIRQFHVSQNYVALSMSIYMLGNCVILLMVGVLAERFGKRKIMLLGNAGFLIFTLLITFSQTIEQFMFWRLLEGTGLAMIAISYGLIHENFNDQDSVKLIALMANVSLLAPLLGPVFGSLIVSFLSWHFVFYVPAAISLVSLLGLIKTMPKDKTLTHSVNAVALCQQYFRILLNKQFIQGSFCMVLTTMPLLLWISQAPNLILYKLNQPYAYYMIYQVISIGGLVLSSFLMRGIAGKYKISAIIKTGSMIILSGLGISTLGYHSIWLVALGEGIYGFGLGLANSCTFRLVMSNKNLPPGMTSSMLVFLETFFSVLGIEFMNRVADRFNYNLPSFALVSLIFGILAFFLIRFFLVFYQKREWE